MLTARASEVGTRIMIKAISRAGAFDVSAVLVILCELGADGGHGDEVQALAFFASSNSRFDSC